MMEESIFEGQLEELVNEIDAIPGPNKEKLVKMVKKTSKCHSELKKNIARLQESLDFLRVSVKYMVFDLEATRRENGSLKKLLKDKNG